jgi:hypothetical protein
VGRVISTNNTITPGRFVEVSPVWISGTEAMNSTLTASNAAAVSIFAVPLNRTPAYEDLVQCEYVPHRWVCRSPPHDPTLYFSLRVLGCTYNNGLMVPVNGASVTIRGPSPSTDEVFSGITNTQGWVYGVPLTVGSEYEATVSVDGYADHVETFICPAIGTPIYLEMEFGTVTLSVWLACPDQNSMISIAVDNATITVTNDRTLDSQVKTLSCPYGIGSYGCQSGADFAVQAGDDYTVTLGLPDASLYFSPLPSNPQSISIGCAGPYQVVFGLEPRFVDVYWNVAACACQCARMAGWTTSLSFLGDTATGSPAPDDVCQDADFNFSGLARTAYRFSIEKSDRLANLTGPPYAASASITPDAPFLSTTSNTNTSITACDTRYDLPSTILSYNTTSHVCVGCSTNFRLVCTELAVSGPLGSATLTLCSLCAFQFPGLDGRCWKGYLDWSADDAVMSTVDQLAYGCQETLGSGTVRIPCHWFCRITPDQTARWWLVLSIPVKPWCEDPASGCEWVYYPIAWDATYTNDFGTYDYLTFGGDGPNCASDGLLTPSGQGTTWLNLAGYVDGKDFCETNDWSLVLNRVLGQSGYYCSPGTNWRPWGCDTCKGPVSNNTVWTVSGNCVLPGESP